MIEEEAFKGLAGSHLTGREEGNWMVFRLEKAIYDHYAAGNAMIDASFLSEQTVLLQKQLFGELLDEDTVDPYEWVMWGDLFYQEPFHGYQYTVGSIIAKHLSDRLLLAEKEGEREKEAFFARYHRFLELLGEGNEMEACAILGFPIQDRKFWAESCRYIVRSMRTDGQSILEQISKEGEEDEDKLES